MAATITHASHQLHDRVLRSRRVLVATHERADGDALGSLLAFRQSVQNGGREVVALAPVSTPRAFSFLEGVGDVLVDADPVNVGSFDLVVLFDCGDVARTHLAEKLYFLEGHRPPVALMDHHAPRTTFRERNLVDSQIVQIGASSTCELVYRYLDANRLPLRPSVATALLTGIITDTGGFTNPGTTVESLEIASELLRRGASLRKVVNATVRSKTVGILQLWGRALSRLEYNAATDVVSTALTLEDFEACGVDREGAEGIASFLNSLGEGKVALVLREEPNGMVKGSYRTKQNDVDVAALAGRFGGGGHKKAAGFSVSGKIVRGAGGWTVVPAAASYVST